MAKIKKTLSEIRAEREKAKYYKTKKNKPGKNKKRKVKKSAFPDPKELKGKSYTEFLKSEYWNKVRIAVLKRDKYQCKICQAKTNLQVHHDNYKNHFNEHKHLEDLITLCRNCHKEHHYAQM